ncbi:hypothetical protein B0H10DRAFT_2216005 [Mycena sp. CBHHK59/15]|nr:hypothetical protein B0H10DRAFT_2216005 [Mycena sp. CBHHK59/15]
MSFNTSEINITASSPSQPRRPSSERAHLVCTIACDTKASTCLVAVPSVGFALVFFTDSADSGNVQSATYSTSAYTRTHNTARVDATSLSASNGNSGKLWDGCFGSTSQGSASGAVRQRGGAGAKVVLGAALGGAVFAAAALFR